MRGLNMHFELIVRMRALSLTPRFSEVSKPSWTGNRFGGFSHCVETANAVTTLPSRQKISLKRGVSDTGDFNPGQPMKFPG
jgi:hypothetical protein